VRIATLNVRNTADRWRDRRGLLVRQLVDLAPDVLGLQELRMVPDQAAWIVREVDRVTNGRLQYRYQRRPKTGRLGLWEGIGVLSRLPVVATAGRSLGADARVALLVTVRLPGGDLLDVYDTHLATGGEHLRAPQAQRLLDWMDARPPLPAALVGDLNARPGSPTIELLSQRLRSAHAAVHGSEPPRTAPTPLRIAYTGDGAVLDYIFLNHLLEARDARLAFDAVDPGDPTLAASDHYGLAVTVAVAG
jgi:endonuclease/exonuclease/phosphatase family metal-dependent hydrolase